MTPDTAPVVFDPAPLTPRQRSGDACVGCGKIWPRPRHRVGVLGETAGDGDAPALFGDTSTPTPVRACDDCLPAILTQQGRDAS